MWIDVAVAGYGHGCDGKGGGWPGLRQAIMVRITREPVGGGKPVVEEQYYLTSLKPAIQKPAELLATVRRHWLIENELHHLKDRTLREDAQRHRPGAVNTARLRSLAVGLIAGVAGRSIPHKREHLAAKPQIAVELLNRGGRARKLL